jgi:hypothetical protein
MEAVREWLGSVGLGMYADAFESQGYDELELLHDLSMSDIEEIVQAVGMRAGHSAYPQIATAPLCACAFALR